MDSSEEPTKLVTFLGKGGSGKSTAAVIAAQVNAKNWKYYSFFCLLWRMFWLILLLLLEFNQF